MNKNTSILLAALASSVWCFPLLAQTEQSKGEVPPPPKFEDVTTTQDSESNFQVEERRFENRLDSVKIEHQNSGVRDYYDLNDPGIERREGGISEQGAMRTWRFGGNK